MFRQDVLMRQVRMLADALARAMALHRVGRRAEALAEIQSTGQLFDPHAPRRLTEVPDDEIVSLVRAGGGQVGETATRIVALLALAAEVYDEEDRPDDRDLSYRKALVAGIAVLADTPAESRAELADRVEALLTFVSPGALSSDTLVQLLAGLVVSRRYGRAEDILFLLLERNHPDVRELGATFYETLARVSPTLLRRGNLPLNEVNEGRAEFLRRLGDRR